MRWVRIVLACAVGVLPLAPLAVHADSHGELKAAFERAVETFNARQLDPFMQSFHDQVVTFDGAPFPRQSRAERRRDFENLFANTERAVFVPVEPRFRVIGEHGIVWGHWALAVKPKDGPADTNYGRFTLDFLKSGGKWLVISEHFSPLAPPN